MPIKDENKRNYYINLCIKQNLSVRELRKFIKYKSFERSINKPEHIELIVPKKDYLLFGDIKNPIIIEIDKNQKIKSEKDLEITILSEIEFILTQFGEGYCFKGSQYKINNSYIDILLFNIEFNCSVTFLIKIFKK